MTLATLSYKTLLATETTASTLSTLRAMTLHATEQFTGLIYGDIFLACANNNCNQIYRHYGLWLDITKINK